MRYDRNETDPIRRRIVELLAGRQSSPRIGGIGQQDMTTRSQLTAGWRAPSNEPAP